MCSSAPPVSIKRKEGVTQTIIQVQSWPELITIAKPQELIKIKWISIAKDGSLTIGVKDD